jgi:hypothetical protein
MTDPIPTTPAPGAPGSPPVSAQGIVQAFVAVLTRPASFFESVKGQTGYGPPLVFAIVMGVVGGVIHAIFTFANIIPVFGFMAGVGMIILMPIFAVIGCFIGGAIVHIVAMIAGGKGTFEQSVRIAGYSAAILPVSAVLTFIPVVRHLPAFYGLYIAALGIIALHLADRRKTFVITGVLAAVMVVFVLMGMMAGAAARRAGEEIRTRYGEGSQFQREMKKSAEEMRKAAEEMRKATEEAQKNAEREGK